MTDKIIFLNKNKNNNILMIIIYNISKSKKIIFGYQLIYLIFSYNIFTFQFLS